MRFNNFDWDDDNISHIARHGIDPKEAEEACFIAPFIQRAKGQGRYYVLGQSESGRYLAIVVEYRYETVRVITAREMTDVERRRYRRR